MENVADALKLAYGVLIFVVAISLSISTFSNARQAIDNIITNRDKTQDYVYVQEARSNNRIVGIESVIEAMYKAYKENYRIEFFKRDANGQESKLILYSTQETQYTSDWTNINYIDLEEEKFANENKAIEHLEALLTKNGDNFQKQFIRYNTIRQANGNYINGNKILYREKIGENIGNEGLYKFFKDKKFEEHLGEYYQEDKSAGKETEALEINKTKKRIITYIMIEN